jgi:hypothetical protein
MVESVGNVDIAIGAHGYAVGVVEASFDKRVPIGFTDFPGLAGYGNDQLCIKPAW